MNIVNEIDLTTSMQRDITVEFGRTLLAEFETSGMTGFYLSGYTGSSLVVLNQQGQTVSTYSIADGSIIIEDSVITLNKTYEEMSYVRRGQYQYTWYVNNDTERYGLFRGKYIII